MSTSCVSLPMGNVIEVTTPAVLGGCSWSYCMFLVLLQRVVYNSATHIVSAYLSYYMSLLVIVSSSMHAGIL